MNFKNFLPGLTMYCVLGLSVFGLSAYADAPYINPADDSLHFGSPYNLLYWTPEQQVAGYRNSDQIFWTRPIYAGDKVYTLPHAKVDLGDVEVKIDGASMTVDEYFTRQSVAGLLVIKDGKVLYERYGLGNTEQTRWISFSVAKSVVSMLIGAAIHDGSIKSVHDKVTEYLPSLKGSSYDRSSIANLLQMASGVRWNEDYSDPQSDVATASWKDDELYKFLENKPLDANPGERFNYNTAETNLAGILLRNATGKNLSTYLSDKIWKPYGMEFDGSWNLTEDDGGEFGGCCINATLRDYGRIGLFALADGRLADGTEVLPPAWMKISTVPSRAYKGYGYFWWLMENDAFRADGIFGQGIYINRKENVVIALHSARPIAYDPIDKTWEQALYRAITNSISD